MLHKALRWGRGLSGPDVWWELKFRRAHGPCILSDLE